MTKVSCPFKICKNNVEGECSRENLELTEVYCSEGGVDTIGEYYLDCQDFAARQT